MCLKARCFVGDAVVSTYTFVLTMAWTTHFEGWHTVLYVNMCILIREKSGGTKIVETPLTGTGKQEGRGCKAIWLERTCCGFAQPFQTVLCSMITLTLCPPGTSMCQVTILQICKEAFLWLSQLSLEIHQKQNSKHLSEVSLILHLVFRYRVPSIKYVYGVLSVENGTYM